MKLYYLVLCSVCLLNSCTQKWPDQVPPLKTKQAHSVASITSWQFSGALAAKNHKQGWAASIHWQQQGPDEYAIQLYGPLGSNAMLIEKKQGMITLHDGPQHYTATKADELLARKAGIRVPVENLFYWVRGLPAPGLIDKRQWDEEQHLITLYQAGYIIEYAHYQTVHRVSLPGKISISGHGIKLKIVIKNWGI